MMIWPSPRIPARSPVPVVSTIFQVIQGTPSVPPASCCSTKPPLRPCSVPSTRSMPTYAAGFSVCTVMMSVSLVPTRSPWNVFVMCALASFTPSRSSCGSWVSKPSISKVPSALLMPVTLPHGADSRLPGSGQNGGARRSPGWISRGGALGAGAGPVARRRSALARAAGEAVGDEPETDAQHPDVLADGDAGVARPDAARLAHGRGARVHRQEASGEPGQRRPGHGIGHDRDEQGAADGDLAGGQDAQEALRRDPLEQ